MLPSVLYTTLMLQCDGLCYNTILKKVLAYSSFFQHTPVVWIDSMVQYVVFLGGHDLVVHWPLGPSLFMPNYVHYDLLHQKNWSRSIISHLGGSEGVNRHQDLQKLKWSLQKLKGHRPVIIRLCSYQQGTSAQLPHWSKCSLPCVKKAYSKQDKLPCLYTVTVLAKVAQCIPTQMALKHFLFKLKLKSEGWTKKNWVGFPITSPRHDWNYISVSDTIGCSFI